MFWMDTFTIIKFNSMISAVTARAVVGLIRRYRGVTKSAFFIASTSPPLDNGSIVNSIPTAKSDITTIVKQIQGQQQKKGLEEPANKKTQDSPPPLELLLSKNALDKCSPLMRSLLGSMVSKGLLVKPTVRIKIQANPSQSQRTPLDYNRHNLSLFRHMLAGPLPNEASLDKFCLKKECPLVVQVKYDGERTVITFDRNKGLQMRSRNGKAQEHTFRSLYGEIEKQLMATDIESIMVDGQIMALDRKTLAPLSFGELMKHKRTKEVQLIEQQQQDSDKLFLVYIFDVLQLNGKNLLQTELMHRRQFIPDIPAFKLVEYRLIHYPQQRAKIFSFFSEVLQRRYEGLIIKGATDKYYTNDTRVYWKKIKRGFMSSRKDPNISQIQLDLVVMGAKRGVGVNNRDRFASFLLGTPYQGRIVPISFVGSGFTAEMLNIITEYIKDRRLEVETIPVEYDMWRTTVDTCFRPDMVFEVHAQEFTVSSMHKLGDTGYGGLSLRFPIFKCIREDKGVGESSTGEEILQLSKGFNLHLPQ